MYAFNRQLGPGIDIMQTTMRGSGMTTKKICFAVVGESARSYTHLAVQMHVCTEPSCGEERNKDILQQMRFWELEKGRLCSKNGQQQQAYLKEGTE